MLALCRTADTQNVVEFLRRNFRWQIGGIAAELTKKPGLVKLERILWFTAGVQRKDRAGGRRRGISAGRLRRPEIHGASLDKRYRHTACVLNQRWKTGTRMHQTRWRTTNLTSLTNWNQDVRFGVPVVDYPTIDVRFPARRLCLAGF